MTRISDPTVERQRTCKRYDGVVIGGGVCIPRHAG
jgi:hypothetical protein